MSTADFCDVRIFSYCGEVLSESTSQRADADMIGSFVRICGVSQFSMAPNCPPATPPVPFQLGANRVLAVGTGTLSLGHGWSPSAPSEMRVGSIHGLSITGTPNIESE